MKISWYFLWELSQKFILKFRWEMPCKLFENCNFLKISQKISLGNPLIRPLKIYLILCELETFFGIPSAFYLRNFFGNPFGCFTAINLDIPSVIFNSWIFQHCFEESLQKVLWNCFRFLNRSLFKISLCSFSRTSRNFIGIFVDTSYVISLVIDSLITLEISSRIPVIMF